MSEHERNAKSGELQEVPGIAARLRRHFGFSLFGLMALAIPLGALAAYGSFGFLAAFGALSEWIHAMGRVSTGLSQMILLAAGGLFFGLVLKGLNWERFRGPANVIVAVHEYDGRYRRRDGLVTAACDALALGVGASVGRYGPAVQLGATLGAIFGQSLGLSRSGLKILLGCGVAAAISASFNAPIAGVIFAHEVIIGHITLRAFAPITVASVVGVGVMRYHDFQIEGLKMAGESGHLVLWEYPVYFLLGVMAAGVALVYMKGLLRSGEAADRVGVPIWLQPAIGGALAGAIGLWLPQVLGLGTETMLDVLNQDSVTANYGLGFLLLLCGAKLLASVSCLGLRYPGGVFTPAIFMGAMLGGAAAFAVPFLDYQICVLVGMGALVSAVIGAPLATILIVFELTENYEAATAVMIGVVAANGLVSRYYARSIFYRQILRWGIDLDRPREQRLMAVRPVSEIMSHQFLAVRPGRTAGELRRLVERGHEGDVFVAEKPGRRLVGRLPLSVLVSADPNRTAGDLCEPVDYFLEAAGDQWSGFLGIEHFVGYSVPVVDDADSMKLVGTVTEGDFISAYRRTIDEVRE